MSSVYRSDLNPSSKTGQEDQRLRHYCLPGQPDLPRTPDILEALPSCGRRRRRATSSGPGLGGWALVARVPAPNRSGQPGSARDRCACRTAYCRGVRGRADQRRGAASTIQWLAATALAASHWSWRTRRNARSRHAFQLGSPSPATVLAKTSSAAARTVTRRCGREARNRPRQGTWPTSPSDTAWPSSSRASTASCSLMTCNAEAAGR
jgi:hypothetical protein